MSLWLQDGFVIGQGGALIDCPHCPCAGSGPPTAIVLPPAGICPPSCAACPGNWTQFTVSGVAQPGGNS